MYNMKPSFLTSTLSLAFILCVVSVIVMAFLHITPDKELLAVISGVVAAYLASRNPSTYAQEHAENEVIQEEVITRE